ncbi:MAG: mechanosensitive ion channel protein, partial [Planktothrix sp.]
MFVIGKKFMRYRVRAITIAGLVCVFALWATPAKTQENAPEEVQAEQVQPAAVSADPKLAITTQDPTIPVDELELLVRPLSLEELQNESAAWLILLKDKVQKISNAEIAIKRQNQSINKQQEASDSLHKSQEALKAAEEQLKTATPGSPEYQEATKKVEEAKENLKKGQESIDEAQEAKKDVQKDDSLKEAIDNAKGTGELDKAKEALDKAKKQRD